MDEQRPSLTVPVVSLYRVERLRDLADCRGVLLCEAFTFPISFSMEALAWVEVFDMEPEANLAHCHLYRVHQQVEGRWYHSTYLQWGYPPSDDLEVIETTGDKP